MYSSGRWRGNILLEPCAFDFFGEVGKWGKWGKWGSGEVGKWGKWEVQLKPQHPNTPTPQHPNTQNIS
ncbi:MAG UNVERIFIED_CONTAM: hypothetical protein LVR29_26790 [Microcystis novacekii LVE1205-3]